MARKSQQFILEDYFKDVHRYRLLSRDEEKSLIAVMHAGDKEAFHHLCRSNLRLVVSIARQYQGRGVGLDDLVQEGNLGLMKSFHKFDPAEDVRVSTYATWWIHQYCKRAVINMSKTIHIPAHFVGMMFSFEQKIRILERENKAYDPRTLWDSLRGNGQLGYDVYLGVKCSMISLNQPAAGEEDPWIEQLEMPKKSIPFENEALDLEHVQRAYARLSEREKEIIGHRYGLHGRTELTLKELGERFSLSRERIRQIQGEAIRKMSHYLLKNHPYLESA